MWLSKIFFKYDNIILLLNYTNFYNGALKIIMNSRDMKKKSNFKYLRSWNLHPKLQLAIAFWAVLLMITFEDLILIFYIWVPNTTIEGSTNIIVIIIIIIIKNQLKHYFATLLGIWPKTFGFSIPKHFSVYLTVLASLWYSSHLVVKWWKFGSYIVYHISPRIEGVHLHLIYVYTCENPLFSWGGGIYLPSLSIFHPISS